MATGVLRFVGPLSGGALSADPASGFGSYVAVGDVDGDGSAESFVAAPGASAVAYRSATESDEFSIEQLGLTDAVLGAGLHLNDVDGDGYTDLVLSIIDDAGKASLLVVPGAPGGLALAQSYPLGV